ncbi:replication initiation factor domain-containing protein [Clostridium sp. chh4-2]|uniref:replication initiation factor domain-containing protein n=1 Tax=Clostridium sp. chh4-2 TaxID=2067550 RepID=UPI000CCDF0DC|nr:replication initiation factor domain-containing protein [Clostridium sp. chh4-2]PNV61489.1 replication initiation factor domain-containing protein [Clostridium sp. chh4-2]
MNLGNSFSVQNGLRLVVDWLSWTLEEPCNVNMAISMMGYSVSDFQVLPKGLNGYRSQMRHCFYPISVQYDGQDGMGIHVDVSGSAISDMIDHFMMSRLTDTPFGNVAYKADSFDSTVLCDFLARIKSCGHITRIDLAIDDIGANFYTLSELVDILSSGNYVSKFRSWRRMDDYKHGNEISGYTVYMGSRTSEIMLRVYDKQLELNKALLLSGQPIIEYPWVRWELELKQSRAVKAVDLILSGHSISDVVFGILSNYLRLIVLDNVRIDRCTTSEKWLLFIGGISKLSLYCPKEIKTLEDKKIWLGKQVAPTLAAVVISEGGSIDYIYKLVKAGSTRLKKHHVEIMQSASGGIL